MGSLKLKVMSLLYFDSSSLQLLNVKSPRMLLQQSEPSLDISIQDISIAFDACGSSR